VVQTRKGTVTALFPRHHYSSQELYDLLNVAPLSKVSVARKHHAVRVNSGRGNKGPHILGLIAVDVHVVA
jgi:hypothetical protein